MKKTLSLKPAEERTDTPNLTRKGRGWAVAESRRDTLFDQAREMKRNPSPAQALLAEKLSAANLGKFKFHRCVVIGSAIVDFACKPLGVVIEVEAPDADPAIARRRDKSLEEVGNLILRFGEGEVLEDPDRVVADVLAAMKRRYDEKGAARRSPPRRDYQR